ncbi:MAG: LysR family transcriptional regulator [Clostridiales bacterium]|nr:LysR family transcriptional regulator [Clostridiales bacterium]
MTINQIECFVETAKTGNISKAAKNLFITQQAASTQLRALENELGFDLLIRGNRGVSLTKEGDILFGTWHELMEKFRISVDQAKDFHTRKSGRLRIGLEDMGTCSADIMTAFSVFEEKYHHLSVSLEIMSPGKILEQFQIDALDMAIAYGSEFQGNSMLKSLPLHEKRLNVCIYLSESHPLAKKADLSLNDIKDVPLGILRGDSSLDFEQKMKSVFRLNGMEAPVRYCIYESRRELEINLIAARCAAITYETLFDRKNDCLISRKIDVGTLSSCITLFWKSEEIDVKARTLQTILQDKLKKYDQS